ncbi:MAG: OB-fold domain-containing protein [Rhodococcus fascians]
MNSGGAVLVPAVDETSRFFWEATARGELRIQQCRACSTMQHPPRAFCRNCMSFDLGSQIVSGRATVVTFTIAMQSFHPSFDTRLPYVLVVVELCEQAGLRMISNLVRCDPEDVAIGADVEVEFVEQPGDFVLPLFRPATHVADATQ